MFGELLKLLRRIAAKVWPRSTLAKSALADPPNHHSTPPVLPCEYTKSLLSSRLQMRTQLPFKFYVMALLSSYNGLLASLQSRLQPSSMPKFTPWPKPKSERTTQPAPSLRCPPLATSSPRDSVSTRSTFSPPSKSGSPPAKASTSTPSSRAPCLLESPSLSTLLIEQTNLPTEDDFYGTDCKIPARLAPQTRPGRVFKAQTVKDQRSAAPTPPSLSQKEIEEQFLFPNFIEGSVREPKGLDDREIRHWSSLKKASGEKG